MQPTASGLRRCRFPVSKLNTTCLTFCPAISASDAVALFNFNKEGTHMQSHFSTTGSLKLWLTILAVTAIALSASGSVSHAQVPATQPSDAVSSYQRFLQSERAAVKPRISLLTSSNMAALMKAVQVKPSLADMK